LLYAYTVVSFAFPLLVSKEKVVRIGSKTFTEQYVLSEILARKIEGETGLSTRVIESLGSTVAFDALVAGDIDLYVDYSGTLWATVMGRDTVQQDRQKVLAEIKEWLEAEHGLRLIGPLGFENAYVLAVRQEDAERLGLETISDLRFRAPDMVIGGDYEFFGRPEWQAIRETYGLSFERRRRMDSSLMYQAADQGDVDVIAAFSTDGRIDALGLKVLQDDRHAIPPYDAIMLAVPGLPEEAVEALEELQNTITADKMRRMNRTVDEGEKSPAEAAEDFLRNQISTSGRNHYPDVFGELSPLDVCGVGTRTRVLFQRFSGSLVVFCQKRFHGSVIS
jgi:osmoprotectant transport system permease protein